MFTQIIVSALFDEKEAECEQMRENTPSTSSPHQKYLFEASFVYGGGDGMRPSVRPSV